ncbi:MAG: carboxymuconolactone decarboxylase family protein [Ramlibacter sp.]|uniref:carboxymuconolactone decarboxylase family protein n=1 Tax=Ramlibacter sp. TaxID=1917967 RepID=UPI00262EEF21|nr:carboxymuconolactone decarboxylase family protein [Ramlibacter sp.]MDH4376831.1 carboxymuconolactone decarboxylase family protein [Ramlibacter sp.]
MTKDYGLNDEGESLHPDEVLARALKRRGDIFDQFKVLIRESAPTYDLISKTAGYVHHYTGKTGSQQQLSGVMRELITLSMLAAKAEHGFTPNHVRRLYNLGVTNVVMLEAAAAMAAVTGWTTVAHTAAAILVANTPDYPFGSMPPGGEPKELVPFPEMEQGRSQDGTVSDNERDQDEYAYIAALDPELARVAARWVNHCLTPTPAARLGAGPRELVAIAAACARGETDLAAQHMLRAYSYGMTRTQVLEAVSCVLPMTGAMTLKIGVQAMRKADAAT